MMGEIQQVIAYSKILALRHDVFWSIFKLCFLICKTCSQIQYAQRACSAWTLLQCVLFRATWPHLFFGNAKVPSGRNYWFCHAGMVYCRRFRSFAENSLQFSFVSSGFGLASSSHILTVEVVFARTHSHQSSRFKDIWPDLISRDLLLSTSIYPLC